MSVTASDNVGITAANLRIFNASNALVYSTFMYKTAGTAQSGTWANDWAIPCSALIGKYRVSVQLSDAAGNLTAWTDLPNFWVAASTVQDKSAPVIVSMYISPGPITVGATIPEVSVRATDDTGISRVIFTLTDPRGFTVTTFDGYRSSGTKTDGIFKNDWATTTSYLSGRYTVYVDVIDEWQKKAGFRVLGTIDLNPVPTVTPTPAPAPAVGDAAMKVTPYYSSSSSTNSSLIPASQVTLKAKSSALFAASTLFASGNNSGLLSLGHLLEVSTSTPAVCSVTGVTTWDRYGGIYTRATINGLASGTCTVTWRFLGSTGRAATSTVMNLQVTP
jgi:hypothetical protein